MTIHVVQWTLDVPDVDLNAADGDVQAEVERLIALGARRADVGQKGDEGSRCSPTRKATVLRAARPSGKVIGGPGNRPVS